MNTEEMNWLLQTIKDPEAARRFVWAQYQHGRISCRVMAEVAPERDRIRREANQFLTLATDRSTEYATPELSIAAAF
jgi:hypothetical protein